jgi:hypothetical protein
MIRTRCSKCGGSGPFYSNRGHHSWCKPCTQAYGRQRFTKPEVKAAHKGRYVRIKTIDQAYKRIYHRMRKYGVTADMFYQMWNAQKGMCPICETHMRRPCVDHCHETGRIRGLLCLSCNAVLGHMRDDPDTLERAARYLRRGQLYIVGGVRG